MTPPAAPQRKETTPTPRADLHLVADNSVQEPTHQPQAGWRFTEGRNSFKIASAQKPIMMIAEASAGSYGAMAKYITESFPNMPFVFETDKAEADFLRASGMHRGTIINQTIGVCSVSKQFNEKPDGVFTSSDCIVVMGTPKADTRKALNDIMAKERPVIIKESVKSVATYTPTAGVNIPQIREVEQRRNIERTPQWLDRIKSMRPCLA